MPVSNAASQHSHSRSAKGSKRRLRRPRTGETSLERLFRFALMKANIPFEENVPLGLAQPDFYFRKARVVVECDGRYWHSSIRQQARDRQKDAWYKGQGLTVLRFTENEITRNPTTCIAQLKKALS